MSDNLKKIYTTREKKVFMIEGLFMFVITMGLLALWYHQILLHCKVLVTKHFTKK